MVFPCCYFSNFQRSGMFHIIFRLRHEFTSASLPAAKGFFAQQLREQRREHPGMNGWKISWGTGNLLKTFWRIVRQFKKIWGCFWKNESSDWKFFGDLWSFQCWFINWRCIYIYIHIFIGGIVGLGKICSCWRAWSWQNRPSGSNMTNKCHDLLIEHNYIQLPFVVEDIIQLICGKLWYTTFCPINWWIFVDFPKQKHKKQPMTSPRQRGSDEDLARELSESYESRLVQDSSRHVLLPCCCLFFLNDV